MAATVEIDEQNGDSKSPSMTHNIANSNMGSKDAANLDPIKNPIAPGENSFEKWQLIHVTDMGTASKIRNLQVWRTGTLGEHAIHLANVRTENYKGAPSYTTPTREKSAVAVEIMPTSNPGSANLGIGGSLTGTLTSPGYSDFLVHQIQTAKKATAGSTTSMNYQYDEEA